MLIYHDGVPQQDPDWSPDVLDFFGEWHANMTQSLAPVTKSSDGLFQPACFIHTEFNKGTPIVEGLNFIAAFGNWYFGREGPTQLVDDCGVVCNPSCPN